MIYLSDDVDRLEAILVEASSGVQVSFVDMLWVSGMFTKKFCDSKGVHYFDYSLHELLKNPSRLGILGKIELDMMNGRN